MKIPQEYLDKYNNSGTLLVVSSYPPRGAIYGDGIVGVASFAKNSIRSLSSQFKGKIVVLAEMFGKTECYEEEDVLVVRCWKRGSFNFYSDLLRTIRTFSKAKVIEIQFEFNSFGGIGLTIAFPAILFVFRLLQKKTVLVVHQVVSDLDSLAGHIGIKSGSMKLKLYSLILCQFYRLLCLCCDKVILTEKELQMRLCDLGVSKDKLTTIVHGGDTDLTPMDQLSSKKKLKIPSSKKVVLVFGFLAWYKGSDVIVEAFNRLTKENPKAPFRLILGGGPNNNHIGKQHYRKYLQTLYYLAKKNKKIRITGFVKEKEIGIYYSAADLVILPYRTFMASSGPLSLALSYERPFLLSEPLKNLFVNGQKKILTNGQFFQPTADQLAKTIPLVFQDSNYLKELGAVSKKLRSIRDYRNIASAHRQVIDGLNSDTNKNWRSFTTRVQPASVFEWD